VIMKAPQKRKIEMKPTKTVRGVHEIFSALFGAKNNPRLARHPKHNPNQKPNTISKNSKGAMRGTPLRKSAGWLASVPASGRERKRDFWEKAARLRRSA